MKKMNIYLVGGAVRDKLLKLDVYDRDWVVVGSTIKQMLDLKFNIVGKDFPVFLHPFTKEEYALARKDLKISLGYKGFNFDVSKDIKLKDDLYRRDLTINSISLDLKGNIYDPYDGISDFNNRIIKHVSISFIDDPLRILRVARFAAKFYRFGFRISITTILLIRQMLLIENILNLSSERIWQEFLKVLKLNEIFIFIDILKKCNVFIILFSNFFLLHNLTKSLKYCLNFIVWNLNKKFIKSIFCYNNSYIVFIFVCFLLFISLSISNYFNFIFFRLNILYIINSWCFFYRISNKYKKNLSQFFCFYYFYNKFLNISNNEILFFLKKNDLIKDKLKFISYLLLSEFYYKKINSPNSVYFYKYFVIDLVDEIYFVKFDSSLENLADIKIKSFVEINYLQIIDKIKNRYFRLFF